MGRNCPHAVSRELDGRAEVLREIHRRGTPPGWAAGPAPAEAFDDPSGPFFEGMSIDDLLRPLHLDAKLFAMRPLPTSAVHDVMKNADVERDLARFDAHPEAVFAETKHVAA